MSVKWFVVKTLYRSKTTDRPHKPDLSYDPDATMTEERILLIKAKNRSEAAAKAEREAKDYAFKSVFINPYQQTIKTFYTGYCDVIELQGHPTDKLEVFTTTRVVSRRIKTSKIAQIYMNNREGQKLRSKRRKFINKAYPTEPS